MRFTIGKKIGLGIAAILGVGVASLLVIYYYIFAVDSSLLRILDVAQPRTQAVAELAINAGETSMSVLKYLDTGDRKFRSRLDVDREEFRRANAHYEQLAEIPEQLALSRKIDGLYQEFQQLGGSLMDTRDRREQTISEITSTITAIDRLVDDRFKKQINRFRPGASRKAIVVGNLETNNAEIAQWLGYYLRTNREKAQIAHYIGEFRKAYAQLRDLWLTSDERSLHTELGRRFEQNVVRIEQTLALHDSMTTNLIRFIDLRGRIDDVLENDIQPLTATALETARHSGENAVRRTFVLLMIMIPLFVLFSLGLAWYFHRGMIRPMQALMLGTAAVRRGNFGYQLALASNDEFGDLAANFNKMVVTLKATTVSKTTLEDSEERFRLMIDSVRDYAIFMLDVAGKVVSWNSGSERIFGYADAEVRGELFSRLYSAEENHRHMPESALGLAVTSNGYQYDAIMQRKNKTQFQAHIAIVPLYDELRLARGFSVVAHDVTERRQAQQRIEHLATRDTLTDLPNRALLTERLAQALVTAERDKVSVAVLFIDLDHFKNINDSLGHIVGDRLLEEVGRRISVCSREGDTVARLGGDEFIMVLSDLRDTATVTQVARRVLASVAEPYSILGHTLASSCSVGISMFPGDGGDGDTLLKHADIAMYQAKTGGRDTYRYFTAEMNATVTKRLQLEHDLRRAIEGNQLVLYYQHQVDLKTGRVTAAEALIRWQRPGSGLVPASDFIPVAEETRLIVPIGVWVLTTACEQLRAWRAAGVDVARIAVNLSATQVDPELPALIQEALQASGIEPWRLEIEITESLLMHNLEHAAVVLREISKTGVSIAIDDFGTGYSSLSMLRQLPIDTLKIDRSFVQDLETNTDSNAIVGGLIAMAHKLNLRVVAEGVERSSQLALLQGFGCDEYQGYLFSRPVDAAVFAQKLPGTVRVFDASNRG